MRLSAVSRARSLLLFPQLNGKSTWTGEYVQKKTYERQLISKSEARKWTANVFCYRILNESVPLSEGRDGNYASTKPHTHLLASGFPTVPLLLCPQLHQR